VSGERGRILALDLGESHIGYALSDPLGITAQPAGSLDARGPKADVRAVLALVREHAVLRVVVGHPLLLSGKPGANAAKAEAFAARLRAGAGDVEVELWDERLTTREAERALISANVRRAKRRQVVDSMAAALLLQSYLDAHAPAG
jgi:putative Holliday junction resolvase